MSDQLESNKAVARQFFALLSSGDIDEALSLFTDEGEWWVAGEDGPGSSKSMPDIAAQFRMVLEGPGKGVTFTERGIVAEGDRVVVEIVGAGTLSNGNEYRNRYCFIVQVKDGKICGGNEYMDTAHAMRAFTGASFAEAAS
jgi:ketosteroid isomerase-like protein